MHLREETSILRTYMQCKTCATKVAFINILEETTCGIKEDSYLLG
jgi:hypothetical protein